MKVEVSLARENITKSLEIPDYYRVRDLLKYLGYTIQGTVVLRNGIPIIEDEKIKDGDKLTIVLTASGG
ncbi:MoaD/ThiS family protein [Acidianus hospitalis]|jgi:sulfur carrier protein|uniref:Thiamine biosynthesis protein ThiS n=2 Tax=Acidianus hospitalis TaxID=563177 RepID=A0A2T9X6C1_9CREN|nr:MoaD/ThiS family protein [Acidianus hospitalis]AEE95139.1 thiamineS protein [Acidianus hospitalis W1]PVU75582.1 thiamine biosynthesis protein ThiS [Acidianus hospitalis]